MTAHDDRARDEQPAVFVVDSDPGLHGPFSLRDEAHEWASEHARRTSEPGQIMSWTVRPVAPAEQPAPAAREIPADELAEARRFAETSPHRTAVEARLAAEVRRQAVELERVHSALAHESDAARAEVERLRTSWEAIRDLNIDLQAEVERLHTWAGLMSLLDEHYPADVVTGESGDPGPRIVALIRELERLRARDEKAAAVVRAWWDRRGVFEQGTELWAALDALARAHEGDR